MSPLPTLLFTAWCTALSVCDLRTRRLPNALTLPGAAAALGYGFATGKPALAILGALLLTLPYLAIHLCAPDALGAGDVKLAFGLGAVTALHGPQTWAWAALSAPMLTAAAGVGMLLAPARPPAEPLLWPQVRDSGRANGSPVHARVPALRLGIGAVSGRLPLHTPTRSQVGAGRGIGGSAGAGWTLAHGAAMCVASVVAVVGGR